ncbi:MAG: M1 family metallopeptidase [Cyclobacteriaceae bacterium]|nr:M1 family metallopeptidase [Cyclobacteriaceae bacterium SS2]
MLFKNASGYAILICLTTLTVAQHKFEITSPDSLKGSITPERVWWDVLHYEISLDIDFPTKSLKGKTTIRFEVTMDEHSPYMQIDLQAPLTIDSLLLSHKRLKFEQLGAAYMVKVPEELTGLNSIEVYYSGAPKVSSNPPYDGGFVWAMDSLNRDWVSVACQLVGGSVWYPCKDHYSEEPDQGASLTITIPDSMGVVVGNGLHTKQDLSNKQARYTWEVKNPINNYGISFYIGHYINISQNYDGLAGPLDLDFWVLDYNRDKAISHLIPESIKTLKAFEKWFGQYPFYEDGFKMVESSYIGMEHQSAIAYGNKFKKGRFSFKNLTALDLQTDRLIVHELAHEWFGNNITMSDMADRWVQEGFAAYGEELFIEEMLGRDAGREFFVTRLPNKIKNQQPLVSDYGIFKDAGRDMYFKGWAIIHTLREMINDDAKFQGYLQSLNKDFYHKTIYSRELEQFSSQYFGMDFGPYFDQYLRYSKVPTLEYRLEKNSIGYRLVADVENLKMKIKLSEPDKWIEATQSWKAFKYKKAAELESLMVDPNFLIEIEKVN